MRDELEKYKIFSRRALILAGLKLSLLTAISTRYYYLQVMKSDKYSTLSENNRIKLVVVPPLRGNLIDRNGIEIANNIQHHRLTLDGHEIKHIKIIIPKIEKLLGRKLRITKEQLKKRIAKRNKNSPLILEDHLSWNDVSVIEVNSDRLPGVEVIEGQIRHYPFKNIFAHITGYIGSPTEAEIEKSNVPNYQEFKVGKSGIEKTFDNNLRGIPGIKKTETNAFGIYVRELSYTPPISGNDMKLSLNAELQKLVYDILTTRKVEGSVVVLDAKTGGVLAMHSTPSFDPNKFVDGVSHKYWNALMANPNNPLINNATAIPYPPGSTFKLVTGLAGLRAGIDPNKRFHCKGYYRVGRRTFKCWKAGGHGSLNFVHAVSQSCNPYFYNIGDTVGIEKIAETARLMGYGSNTGIELPFENPGLIGDKKWKKRRFKDEWYKGDTINVSIGQGYTMVTPIQMATMTARLATGKLIKPTLFLGNQEVEKTPVAIADRYLQLVRKGMNLSANHHRGVVFYRRLSTPGMKVAGKTGTAQVAALKHGKSKNKELKHHALFTSFAPVENPKYVVSVVVEHGEAGSRSAAPIAKAIYEKLATL